MRGGAFQPTAWLGQSVDTNNLCLGYSEFRRASFLTSLGCVIRKPSLADSRFNSKLRSTMGFSGPLMVDSGGFVLSKDPNHKWTYRDVGKFIEKLDADVFVSLDIPPRLLDTPSERRKKILKSAKNFLLLAERYPSKTIMPVVHGRTKSEIELSLGLLSKHPAQIKWIGLGGIVPLLQHRRVSGLTLAPESFIADSLKLLREGFPEARVHVFGAGGTRTFPAVVAMGADSGDSIGWRQAAGFGSVFLPMKSQRAVKWNGEKGPSRKMLDSDDLLQIAECGCPVCRGHTLKGRVRAFEQSFFNRAIHNAWITAHQARYWPQSRRALAAAVANGLLGQNWARALNAVN